MQSVTHLSKSSTDTVKLARVFASLLLPGDVVVLTGDLGAGKTKFVEGILSYFNLENEISSPTFNIINEYSLDNVNIYHFDVYRLSDIDEFYAIGGEEYFEKGICLIEWGEQIKQALPNEYIQISFAKSQNENMRTLTFHSFGEKYSKILDDFLFKINF